MQRELTVRLFELLALVLITGCDPTDTEEPAGHPMDRDAGRSANTGDTARLDSALPVLDAANSHAPDTSVADARVHDARVNDARVDDAQVDGSQALLAAHLAQLATSRARWRELAAASPGPYWYAEENCVLNANGGTVSTIQVEQNVSQVYEERSVDARDCEASVNRYGYLFNASGARDTMEQLYDLCEAQLLRMPASNFVLDARGVIKECWIGQAENPRTCLDACGSGFYLRDWQFGKAQPTPDGGVRKDAGDRTDAGVRTDAGS